MHHLHVAFQCHLLDREVSRCLVASLHFLFQSLLLNMSDTVIVSLEGVNLRSGLVVREMSLYFPRHRSFRHYFFEAPHLELTYGDRRTDRYYRDTLGGIGLETPIPGALRPQCVEEILPENI